MTRWGDGFMAWPAGSRPRPGARIPAGPRPILPIEVEPVAPDAPADLAGPLSALDEELSRLPAKYRDPVVLCHLEGLTHAEAAARLRWPVGTVSGRLSRARGLLKDRLIRRGLAPTAGSLVALLATDGARAACPNPWPRRPSGPRRAWPGRRVARPGARSASAFSLMNEVLRAAIVVKLKAAGAVVLALDPRRGRARGKRPRRVAGLAGAGRRPGDRESTPGGRPVRRSPSRRPPAGR